MATERPIRRLTTILAADIAGYSRLTGTDEEGTLARLRAVRKDLIDPALATHRGRIVKTTGDGMLVEFASVVDAARCAMELQRAMAERQTEIPPDQQIQFRIGINLGDVIVESDGDLMGDGVNIAARIEGIAEPGGICLSEDAYRQVRDKLPVTLIDCGEQQLKNIARPVRVYRADLNYAVTPAVPSGTGQSAGKKSLSRLSTIVLPFVNLNGDPQYDSFAAAVTENLTTDLSSGHPERSVVPRSTALAYQGKSVDAKQIGRELDVHYLLQGTVHHGSGKVRVNVQLVDAQDGSLIWAERFDRGLNDPFETQDEITFRIVRAIDIQQRETESRRSKMRQSESPNASDLLMRAGAAWSRGITRENRAEACRLLELAADLDNSNAVVLAFLAFAKQSGVQNGWSKTPESDARTAAELVGRALAINPKLPNALSAKAWILMHQRKHAAAVEAFERVVELNPTRGGAIANLAFSKIFVGRAEESVTDLHRAMRLTPNDPFMALWLCYMGTAQLFLDRPGEAIGWLERSLAQSPNFDWTTLLLASAYVMVDRLPEARATIKDLLALQPDWTMRKVRSISTFPLPSAVEEGIRKAGLPEE